jgi:predicted RND superfamily exporter protein
MLARLLTRLALSRPLLVIAIGLSIAVAGIALASRLQLQTDLSELLPADAPSVVNLKRLNERVGGTGQLQIAIYSKTGAQALRDYVPRLVEALRQGLGADLLTIKYSRKEADDYFKKFAAYYVPLKDLQDWSQKLAVALSKQNPAYVDLGDDDNSDPLKKLADEVRTSREKLKPRNVVDPQTSMYMMENGHLSAIFVRPASNSLNLGGSEGMMKRIEDIVASTHPESANIEILGYTGSIPLAISEVQAIRHDIVSTAIIVLLGVMIVVGLFFRGIRELALMSGAVAIGAAVALGFAELWIGHVNAQTAFLGAIIVGTGINYGIIFLDRYRSARTREDTFEAALETGIDQSLRPTAIAALATAVSFGVLAAGKVESFHQFGWIGGIGILACWVATFTVVPATIVLFDRHRKPRPQAGGAPVHALFHWLGTVCERAPLTLTVISIALALAGAVLAIGARHRIIETNLRNLGTRSAAMNGIEKLDNRIRDMDDKSSSPAVIATDSMEETKPLCDAINKRVTTDLKGIVRRCWSIHNVLAEDLDQRTPLRAKLRHDIDAIDDEELSKADRDELTELRRALEERPPTPADLPPYMAQLFIERDGSIGKLAYVEPHNEHIESNLYKFTDTIRDIHLPSGKEIRSSGELVVFADVLRAMRHDATYLTIAAAILVMLVLAGVTRHLGSFVRVGGALVAGVLVMFGVAVLLHQKLNFFNFVALPTTFGIGIDYAINIEERIRQRGRAALASALAESGPPVVLASLTSIIGYASLVPADSQALSSFGVLAMIGEITCVLVAIVLVPALWALRRNAPAPAGEGVIKAGP